MPIPDPLFLTGDNQAFTQDADTVPARLTAHARTMAQGVFRVAERFYVAVGYGQSNMTLAVGDDGVIVIDCLETEEHARQALADLRRVSGTDAPVRALIYSHSHPDHISGVRAIVDPPAIEDGRVAIYAHERLPAIVRGNPSLGLVPPLRLAYSFGLGLGRGPEGWVETGLGIQFGLGTTGFVPPTTLFRGSLEIESAGIAVQLREAPSESDDEIVVWFPERRVLYVADVIQGESLPNLYALRGAVRDIAQWIRAVDLLRGYDAQALIFGHGRPLVGADEVRELLTAYRDAMQYLHDQTVRLMARGLTPDELVEEIAELPPHLRDHPWLGEFYGSVKQIVRQVYHTHYGWFEGDPTTIDPLPRRERADRYVAAMGGRDAVVGAAREAYLAGDYRWVAELLTHVLRTEPCDSDARQLKADALRQLGYRAVNPIWRNNYLMAARELDGTLDRANLMATVRAMGNPDLAATMPIPLLLRAFATRLDPARSEGTRFRVCFHCSDTDTSYGLAVRSAVAEVLVGAPPDARIVMHATEPKLRGLLTGRLSWSHVEEDGAVNLTRGTAEDAERFWGLFDSPMGEPPAIALR